LLGPRNAPVQWRIPSTAGLLAAAAFSDRLNEPHCKNYHISLSYVRDRAASRATGPCCRRAAGVAYHGASAVFKRVAGAFILPMLSPFLTAAVLVVGVLIGGVGIGGVLLLPALNTIGGIALHTAIPACMLAYIATGTVGALIYSRHGTVNWRLAAGLCAGGVPGAYSGAFLLPYFSAPVLAFGIAGLLLVSGLHALWRKQTPPGSGAPPRLAALVVIGLITGTGSALSGTGGPLLLIPILAWCRVPVLTSIGLSQVIQVPVSVMATLGNAAHGQVDWHLGAHLALALTAGAALGAKLAHVLATALLHKLVAALLVAAGVFMLARPAFGL